MNRKTIILLPVLTVFLAACDEEIANHFAKKQSPTKEKRQTLTYEVTKTDAEWKKLLTPEQYHVTTQKGTERAYSGEFHDSKGEGIYRCIRCDKELFNSDTKFDSHTGWPSFWTPYAEKSILTAEDNGFFMKRTEVLCSRCGAHLGHVFKDGPNPTGLRYCINSAALKFAERKESPAKK